MRLWHGDCLELMREIPDNSIDMVLTDPPYGTTACKWDTVIDFDLMWEQLKRITKDNGAICLFGAEPFSSALRSSNFELYKYDWYWLKSHTPDYTQAKRKPQNYIENICVFAKTNIGKITYKPQGLIEVNRKTSTTKTKKGLVKTGKSKTYISKYTNYPKTILKYPNSFKWGVNKFHETQKPVALLEYLIKTYTLENETVLDFTMGSGSTGVACKNLNRDFIGIEKDDNYFNIAKERITNVKHGKR